MDTIEQEECLIGVNHQFEEVTYKIVCQRETVRQIRTYC